MYTHLSSHRGFSIIMALGSIGVLMIIVVGMASVFLTDMRLSRLQYDAILSSTQAEWAFEYAMLKIRNHANGFADEMKSSSPDARIFSWETSRTDKVAVSYSIVSNAKKYVFSWGLDSYSIIPLFSGKCDTLLDASSCDPSISDVKNQVKKIISLSTSWNPDTLSWNIVGMHDGMNISISGTGIIDGNETGLMRVREEECFDEDSNNIACESAFSLEKITYFYDKKWTVEAFLSGISGSEFANINITDPYLLIFSSWPSMNITLETDVPFTLPEMEIVAEARKWESLQAIRFREDKSRYYDALKFWVYNNE